MGKEFNVLNFCYASTQSPRPPAGAEISDGCPGEERAAR